MVNGHKLWPDCVDAEKIIETVRKLCGFKEGETQLDSDATPKDHMQQASWSYVQEHLMANQEIWGRTSEGLIDVIKQCLTVDPTKRPDALELLEHPYFEEFWQKHQKNYTWVPEPFLKSSLLPDDLEELEDQAKPKPSTPSVRRRSEKESPAELYHFWKLSGGELPNLSEELQVPSPIHRLPSIVRCNDHPPEKYFAIYSLIALTNANQ